jgi:hypothetical protein
VDTVERAEMVEKQLDAMIERSGSREPDPDEKSALWETGVSPLEAPAQEKGRRRKTTESRRIRCIF